MSRTIRWGVWGAGAVAHRVAADLSRVPGALLHSVGSRTRTSAHTLAERHGASHVFDDLPQMLLDAQLDVVYVATPHHLHAHDATRCLRAGKAVLCEKPLSTSVADAQAIADAATQAQRFCMEAMWTRFIPAVRAALQSVREGAIGEIVGLSGDFSYPVAYEPNSRFFSPDLAGGALLDRGVYLISLAQAVLGEPVRVQASARKAPTGIDAQSAYLLEFANGAIARFSASLVSKGPNSFTLEGQTGRIVLHEPFVCAHRTSLERYEPFKPVAAGSAGKGMKDRLKSLVRASGVHRRLDALRIARQHLVSRSFCFAGEGYQFELEEVMRCLRENRTQSDIMPLADSIAVARTVDRLRACWEATTGDR